jgi:ribosomal protein L12E/L44/L45/RPP1/RPP2
MSSADIAKTAIPYACLLLTDAGVEITEERVAAVLAAAGIEVESVWISTFVRCIKNADVEKLCKDVSSGAGAAAAPVAAAPVAAAPAAAAPSKKAPAPVEEEEEMGFSLFD